MLNCRIIIFIVGFVLVESSTNYNISQLTQPVDHAECPSYDPRDNTLFYVDIHTGRIFSYDWATGDQHSIRLNGEVAPIVQTKASQDLFIVGLDKSIVAVRWDGKSTSYSFKVLATVDQNKPTRMNEGKADREGRIWFGTMGDGESPQGTLYKIGPDLKPVVAIPNVIISNGLTWNKANDRFYYIDSPKYEIVEYQYNGAAGEISNRRSVFNSKQNGLVGQPDGMTIDKDDNLWVALYGDGAVIQVNPRTGQIMQKIPIAARDVTSVIWAGPSFDTLVVTTSRISLTSEEKLQYPQAGSVFTVTGLGTSGLPLYEADVVQSI